MNPATRRTAATSDTEDLTDFLAHFVAGRPVAGEPPLVLDIGGEGRHPQAWNLNPRATKSLSAQPAEPIPRHIPGRADAIPLADGTVDFVIVERTPLRRAALHEIARVVRPRAVILLRHALLPGLDPHRLALELLPGQIRRSIVPVGRQRLQQTIFELGLND